MDAFNNALNGAPRGLDQADINNAIAEQAKTILLQKKQIDYLVGVLSKTLAPQIAAEQTTTASEEAPAPVAETADASAN